MSELTRALRGSLDDVRTGVSARAAGGAAPLRVAVFTDSSMSLAACGLLIGLLVPTLFVERFFAVFVGRSSTVLASIVLFGGYVTRAVQRLRARGTAVGG